MYGTELFRTELYGTEFFWTELFGTEIFWTEVFGTELSRTELSGLKWTGLYRTSTVHFGPPGPSQVHIKKQLPI